MADAELPPDPPSPDPAGDQGRGIPPGSGRARDLVRGRTGRARTRPAADTGRRHHIGEAAELMTVLRPDGSTGTTRTSPVQLRDKNPAQLAALLALLQRDMAQAAADLDFESAAHLREEVAAARAALDAATGPTTDPANGPTTDPEPGSGA